MRPDANQSSAFTRKLFRTWIEDSQAKIFRKWVEDSEAWTMALFHVVVFKTGVHDGRNKNEEESEYFSLMRKKSGVKTDGRLISFTL